MKFWRIFVFSFCLLPSLLRAEFFEYIRLSATAGRLGTNRASSPGVHDPNAYVETTTLSRRANYFSGMLQFFPADVLSIRFGASFFKMDKTSGRVDQGNNHFYNVTTKWNHTEIHTDLLLLSGDFDSSLRFFVGGGVFLLVESYEANYASQGQANTASDLLDAHGSGIGARAFVGMEFVLGPFGLSPEFGYRAAASSLTASEDFDIHTSDGRIDIPEGTDVIRPAGDRIRLDTSGYYLSLSFFVQF